MDEKKDCFYLRPAMYSMAVLGAFILVVALFGGFEPSAIASR